MLVSLVIIQDGKVVLAFDEVKELLPTKHFFKETYGDANSDAMLDEDRSQRSDIPLPTAQVKQNQDRGSFLSTPFA